LWTAHLKTNRLHDARTARRPVLADDSQQSWQRVIGPEESVIVRDSNSGDIILVVIREFYADPGVLAWLDTVVRRVVMAKTSVRLDDPGTLALVGYTSRAQNCSEVMWAKNLLPRKATNLQNPTQLQAFDFDCSSSFALFWNMLQSILPTEVLAGTEKYLESLGLHMDADSNGETHFYGIQDNSNYYEFHSANLAPRQGNYAINYAGFTHNEHNAHEYCYSFTTSRHEPTSQEYGNHFYLSDTAIKVESVGNSVVLWRGKDWHGTTLLNVRPDTLGDEGSFSQVGLSITTSGTLFKAVQKMREMNHPGFSEETGFDIDLEHTDTE
jgi:hypothetical protein